MSVDAGTAVLQIKPDFEGVGRDVENQGRSLFSGMGKNLALAFAGGFVIDRAVDFFKGTIEEAREAQKVGKETARVIASTGGAAGVTAQQVEDLASSLSNMTGIDDEAIQATENLLLTFTNIKDLGGDRNIFSRATSLAQDMSVAFGQDASSSAVQLGKALNDPIKGISALSRVGVTFSEDQKKVIKSLVETGDVAGAQKVILDELAREVGGAAAAQADPIQKMGVLWGNFKEQIGTALLPILNRVVDWASKLLPKAMATAAEWFGRLSDIVKTFWAAFSTGFTEDEGSPLERFALKAREVFDFIADHRDEVIGAIAAIFGVWAAQALLAAAATVIAALPFYAIVGAIAAVGAALVYAYKHWTGFRDVVDTVVSWLKENVPPAFDAIKTAIKTTIQWISDNVVPVIERVASFMVEQFANVVTWVETNWPKITEAIGHVLVAIQTAVAVFVAPFVFVWQNAHTQIMAIVTAAWGFIQTVVETAITIVKNIIELVLNLINGDWGAAWENIKLILLAAWNFMGTLVGFALEVIKNVISGALGVIGGLWSGAWGLVRLVLAAAWNAMLDAVSTALGSIVGFFIELPGRILGALPGLGWLLISKGIEVVKGLLDGIVAKFWDVVTWLIGLPGAILNLVSDLGRTLYDKGVQLIQGFIDGIKDKAREVPGALASAVPGGSIAGSLIGALPGFALGGIIDRPMIAQLHSNEVVIPLSNPARALELAHQSGLLDLLGGAQGPVMPVGADSAGGGGIVNNFNAPITIGSEDVVAELDWYSKVRLAGV